MSNVKKNDSVFRELRAKIGELAKAHAKVGVLQSQGGDAAHGGDGTTLAEIMAIHEFGAPAAGIPKREPVRRALVEGEGEREAVAMTAKVAQAVIKERVSVDQALEILGQWGVARVKAGIKAGLEPELKQATIDRKGSSTPLIDTGQLIGSITYEVKKE